jgi:cytochrome P450 family 2 subfamily J
MKTFDQNHMRDFIDVYINEMKQDKTGFFTGAVLKLWLNLLTNILLKKVEQLTAICVDLFLAGTETTASTIGFTLRYMIKFPEIQQKVREELHRVVGKERLPSMEDMPK